MTTPTGVFVTIDGPGGVGKSTVLQLTADILRDGDIPTHTTTEPTRTALGDHIRHGTHTYRGMALACLVAGDRHHHLDSEIRPALRGGQAVLCDRYLPSSLVLQRLDGLTSRTVWELNVGVLVPDIAVILTADPDLIASRLARRGGHSRFELQPGASRDEVRLYHQAVVELADAGWPLYALDATEPPATIARTIARQIMTTYLERSTACPA